MKKNIAVFFDRDGTINEEVGYMDSLEKLRMLPVAGAAIRLVNWSKMKAIVITNQSGVAKGFFDEELVRSTHELIQSDLNEQGAHIDKFYYCPHHPTEGHDAYRQACDCRKPEPGMILSAADEFNIELAESYLVGDTLRDIQAARKAGLKAVLVRTGYGAASLASGGATETSPESTPDFVAEDILEAVQWILKDRGRE
jgi:D-glycero-D-manno-heptose 1,7-bisphosphate phosphatase